MYYCRIRLLLRYAWNRIKGSESKPDKESSPSSYSQYLYYSPRQLSFYFLQNLESPVYFLACSPSQIGVYRKMLSFKNFVFGALFFTLILDQAFAAPSGTVSVGLVTREQSVISKRHEGSSQETVDPMSVGNKSNNVGRCYSQTLMIETITDMSSAFKSVF